MQLIDWIRTLWQQPITAAGLASAACYFFYRAQSVNQSGRKFRLLLRLVFSIALIFFSGTLIERFFKAEVFDFTAFYLYGRAVAQGFDVYRPDHLAQVFSGIPDLPPLDFQHFKEEIVDAGAMYPPPTMLLYAPFGTMPFQQAEKAWMIFTWSFAFLSIHQLYRMGFRKFGVDGLILVGSLLMLLSASRQTAHFLQTNFITLYLLLLMKRFEDRPVAGVFLALGFLVKPYMALFGLVFLFRKQWRTIAVAALTAVVYVSITLAIWGKGLFLSYLFDNPSRRLSNWVFQEPINQSLHAAMLRSGVITPDHHWVFTLLAALLLLLTGLILYRLGKRQMGEGQWMFVLLVALLVYPGTLSYYGVMLLFLSRYLAHGSGFFERDGSKRAVLTGIGFLLSAVSLFSSVVFLIIAGLFAYSRPIFLKKWES